MRYLILLLLSFPLVSQAMDYLEWKTQAPGYTAGVASLSRNTFYLLSHYPNPKTLAGSAPIIYRLAQHLTELGFTKGKTFVIKTVAYRQINSNPLPISLLELDQKEFVLDTDTETLRIPRALLSTNVQAKISAQKIPHVSWSNNVAVIDLAKIPAEVQYPKSPPLILSLKSQPHQNA